MVKGYICGVIIKDEKVKGIIAVNGRHIAGYNRLSIVLAQQ
jgi:hypothetical protein